MSPPALEANEGDAGWSSPVARQAHNLKVVGSNPTPATKHRKSRKIMRSMVACSAALFLCPFAQPSVASISATVSTSMSSMGERLLPRLKAIQMSVSAGWRSEIRNWTSLFS